MGCQATGEQGEASGIIAVNGEPRVVRSEIMAATYERTSDTWPDGWLALELPGALFESDDTAPPLGPVCIWISGGVLAPDGGVLNVGSPFADVPPPFTRDNWYCLPPEEGAEIFIGVPCAVASDEIFPTTPLPPTPTPEFTPSPGVSPTPAPEAPGSEDVVPHLRAVVGTLTLESGISQACDVVDLTLDGVLFQRQDCGGGVQNLRFDSLRIRGTLLGVGRDWSTGGAASCP